MMENPEITFELNFQTKNIEIAINTSFKSHTVEVDHKKSKKNLIPLSHVLYLDPSHPLFNTNSIIFLNPSKKKIC